MKMVEKKFLITKNYIEVPVVMESELITLEVMQENGDSQTKICEFQVPAGASTGGFKPDYFARFTVKAVEMRLSLRESVRWTANLKNQTLIFQMKACQGRNIILQQQEAG